MRDFLIAPGLHHVRRAAEDGVKIVAEKGQAQHVDAEAAVQEAEPAPAPRDHAAGEYLSPFASGVGHGALAAVLKLVGL